MLTQLGIIVLLSLLNGFFALSEMAVVASRKSRLKQRAHTSRRARIALQLVQHPDRFLSSVQVGITLTVLLTGAVTGVAFRDSIAALLDTIGLPWLAGHAASVAAVIGFVLATFIQIVIGELVPKRMALGAPEKLAALIAMPMLAFARLCKPFIWLLNASSTAVLRLLRITPVHQTLVSEEEIRMLVAESAEQGVLDADERRMVNRVLHLGDRNVGSIMTPRKQIAWLDVTASREDNLAILRSTHYSRYPVYKGDESDVLGVLEIKRVLDHVLNGEGDLFANLVKPLYVPATVRALDLLGAFGDAGARMALVVDEYGAIDGLVTRNDLLESVIGQASGDQTAPGALWRQASDGSWDMDGSLPVDDLRELLHLGQLPHQDEHEYHTLAGMVITSFGHIPEIGESFAWRGFRFQVRERDGARIGKVRVTPLATDTDGDGG